MKKGLFSLAVGAVYVALLCTGMTGTANAQSAFTYNNSAKAVGAINAYLQGDGNTGGFTASERLLLRANGQGNGELVVKIKGPRGFNKVYTLELDPDRRRTVEIRFVAADYVTTTRDYVTTETENALYVEVRLDTTGLFGQYKLSASASGSLTKCIVSLRVEDGAAFLPVSANNLNLEPGHGSLKASTILELYQY